MTHYVVKRLLEELRSLLRSKNQAKCLQKIEIITDFFDETQSNFEISKTHLILSLAKFSNFHFFQSTCH